MLAGERHANQFVIADPGFRYWLTYVHAALGQATARLPMTYEPHMLLVSD